MANYERALSLINKDIEYFSKFNKKDIAAFKILELEIGTIWPKIQNKFKTLVKRFHPDMNSGNKIYENKLKNITLAYSQLKMTYKEK